MPWRVIARGDQVWHVDAVAERRANSAAWHLVLAFKAVASAARPRTHWAPYPLEAASKSALFIQADCIPDSAIAGLLAEHGE